MKLENILGRKILDPYVWKQCLLLLSGAVLVALTSIAFAKGCDWAFSLFRKAIVVSAWVPLILTPLTFGLLSWITEGRWGTARGSGIPQVIACLEIEDECFRTRMLGWRTAFSKMTLTLLALTSGASIGREGPTVHVGAALFYSLSKRFGFNNTRAMSRFILAGSAASISAAFNTPLAGLVFAIEGLAGSIEYRFSGFLLTAVVVGGLVSAWINGSYVYFGTVEAHLTPGHAWLAVVLCGVFCGALGGVFAHLIVPNPRGPLAVVSTLRNRNPVLFALGCGFALALMGLLSHGQIYGTGYTQARDLAQGLSSNLDQGFGLVKLLANVVSYWAGIPGGIFSPALAVGAGIGHDIARLIPDVPESAVVLMGMSAYLAGVTGTPLTSGIIAMELTNNRAMAIPILTTCLVARASSFAFSPTPIYRRLAEIWLTDFERQQADYAGSKQRRALVNQPRICSRD